MSIIIAVDHGNDSIKTEHCHFRTSLIEHLSRPPLESEIVEYGGKYYTLSEERIPYMRDKTRDERFFILTLFAISKELEKWESTSLLTEIDLAVGLPPEHYGRQREHFQRYFKRDGMINYAYKNTAMSITIHNVSVFVQAHAAAATIIGKLRQAPTTFIVDIGGYTTDVLLLRNGRPDMKYCRSLETGIITMNNSLIGQINAQHDMMIEDVHILTVLQGKDSFLPQEIQTAIRNAAEQHARNILLKLRELNVDLRANPVVFIGGGSILLRPYFEQSDQVLQAEFIEDVHANAKGYGMLLAAKLESASV